MQKQYNDRFPPRKRKTKEQLKLNKRTKIEGIITLVIFFTIILWLINSIGNANIIKITKDDYINTNNISKLHQYKNYCELTTYGTDINFRAAISINQWDLSITCIEFLQQLAHKIDFSKNYIE